MVAGLSQQQVAAALAEEVYHRSSSDQALDLQRDLDGTPVSVAPVLPGLTLNDGYWYDNSTGFVGRVVEVGGTVYVVFRGTDIGGSSDDTVGDIVNLITSGGSAGPVGGYDLLDWTRANLPLGMGVASGTTLDGALAPTLRPGGAVTQLDDAIALTRAAMAAAGGRPVVVTGQSLGGGLAGLVSALFSLPAYLFDPAPFGNELVVLAGQSAFKKNELQGLLDAAMDAGSVVHLQLLGALGLVPTAASFGALNVGAIAVSTLLKLTDDSLQGVLTTLGVAVPKIQSILSDRSIARATLELNLIQGIQAGGASRVSGEALSAGPLGQGLSTGGWLGRVLAANGFSNISNLLLTSQPFLAGLGGISEINVGESDQTTADEKRSIALHSPALINLLERTKDSTLNFADLLKQDAVLRSSLFAQPQIVAPIGNDRADPAGGPSKVLGGEPATNILYDALWKTVGGNVYDPTSFYSQFYTRFGDWLSSGAVAAGKSGALGGEPGVHAVGQLAADLRSACGNLFRGRCVVDSYDNFSHYGVRSQAGVCPVQGDE